MAALLGAPPPWPQQPQLGQQGRGGQDSQGQAQVAPISRYIDMTVAGMGRHLSG